MRFFIDTASKIDTVDPQWGYVFGFKDDFIAGFMSYYIFGLSSVKIKSRISQLYVMNPFRSHGLGSKIVSHLYQVELKNINCVGICVEDANDSFINLQFKLLLALTYPKIAEKFKEKTNITETDFHESKTQIEKLTKGSKTNSEIILDVILLHEFSKKNHLEMFHKFLKKRIEKRMNIDKNEKPAKMAKKYLNFEGKIVTLKKIQNIYQEIEEEEEPLDSKMVIEQRLISLNGMKKFIK